MKCCYIISGHPLPVLVLKLSAFKLPHIATAEDDGFLRAIKIRSTTSFGEGVKLSAPCRKILRHLKEIYEYEKILRRQNPLATPSSSFSCFATRDLVGNCKRALADE
jgi:hypothetical protein